MGEKEDKERGYRVARDQGDKRTRETGIVGPEEAEMGRGRKGGQRAREERGIGRIGRIGSIGIGVYSENW